MRADRHGGLEPAADVLQETAQEQYVRDVADRVNQHVNNGSKGRQVSELSFQRLNRFGDPGEMLVEENDRRKKNTNSAGDKDYSEMS